MAQEQYPHAKLFKPADVTDPGMNLGSGGVQPLCDDPDPVEEPDFSDKTVPSPEDNEEAELSRSLSGGVGPPIFDIDRVIKEPEKLDWGWVDKKKAENAALKRKPQKPLHPILQHINALHDSVSESRQEMLYATVTHLVNVWAQEMVHNTGVPPTPEERETEERSHVAWLFMNGFMDSESAAESRLLAYMRGLRAEAEAKEAKPKGPWHELERNNGWIKKWESEGYCVPTVYIALLEALSGKEQSAIKDTIDRLAAAWQKAIDQNLDEGALRRAQHRIANEIVRASFEGPVPDALKYPPEAYLD